MDAVIVARRRHRRVDQHRYNLAHIRFRKQHIEGSLISVELLDQVQEKAQKELVMLRQRLDETLNQEKRAMRCGLVKKRRELISNMVRVHKERKRDLSSMSKSLEEKTEMAQHLQRWQSLLTAHSLELAELINNLDEEAAADIRKVTMRVIQGAVADIKAVQPSATQAVLTLLPPGTMHPVLQVEPETGTGKVSAQGVSAVLQGQERLHHEGKAALHTLVCTREALQEATEKELQEQKELRTHWRDFFKCLCLSQLTLSEDDRLRMKLEFQKCLSVIDRCLMLPHALSRTKLHAALAAWRKEREEQMANMQSKGKTAETRKKTDPSDIVFFQKRLEDKLQLFEKEKEMESGVMDKVMEEMQQEREDYLRSQADGLAMQMASICYQKAERWAKVLETSRAMVALQDLLINQLRVSKHLDRQEMAQSIQRHCSGREEAEQQFQMQRRELDCLLRFQPAVESEKIHQEEEETSEEDRVFQLQVDCRMTTILQEALHKSEQVVSLTLTRFQEATAKSQTEEDLKEQMELKRLYANCDQDLELASQLVKQSHVSDEILLETLRLLLPTLAESELLSITDALYPKQHPVSAELEHSGCAGELYRLLPVKLKENVVQKQFVNMASCAVEKERLQEKRQSLLEKLLPRYRILLPADAAPPLAEERGKQDSFIKAQRHVLKSAELVELSDTVKETLHNPAEENMSSAYSGLGSSSGAHQRVFLFRDPPEPHESENVPKRKRKRNFLNLKKGSVAPAT